MKKKSIIALILSLALVMALFLTSCGSKTPQTLEDYVNSDEETSEQIEEVAETSGLQVEIKGNDVIYTYDLASYDGMNEDLAKSEQMISSLTSALDKTSDSFTGLCSQLEEETEIEGVQIIVNYTFGDEVLVTSTFNKDGKVDQ